jgi:hypothetical protein
VAALTRQRGHHDEPFGGEEQLHLVFRQAPVHVHVREHERFRVRRALEWDAYRPPHRAVRAVAAHHVPGPQALFPPRRPDHKVDPLGILPHLRHLVPPRNLPAESAQRSPQEAFGLVLREH